MEVKCPTVVADGHYSQPKYPKISTANGLQMYIKNYLNWTGNHGERTNNMGRPIKKFAPKMNIIMGTVQQVEIGTEWQKGTGTIGTSDVKGHINIPYQRFAIPCYFEVKIRKDKQSDEQIEYQCKVAKTGGLYVIVKTPDDFLKFYDDVMANRI